MAVKNGDNGSIEPGRNYVKSLRSQAGGVKPFFRKLYGREPTVNEHITLNNYINRGHYNADFVVLLIKEFNLEDVTLGEFYCHIHPPKS
ncbi:hypothetical protein [Marinomonas algicola]|uniref:hypothetical protein n=1 Tax=Marinomonas algicola TaxID=2773454 RepID=UPI00174944DD|nr:hypothetical protein [Marinomonas algicola]